MKPYAGMPGAAAMYKLRSFLALPPSEKRLFLEALMLLGLIRAALLAFAFKCLTHTMKQHKTPPAIPVVGSADQRTAVMIGRCIGKAAHHTPWESACMIRAMTARIMLQRRDIPGVFFLGVAKEGDGADAMKAHAWAQCGRVIVTGAEGHEAFTVLSVFEWGA